MKTPFLLLFGLLVSLVAFAQNPSNTENTKAPNGPNTINFTVTDSLGNPVENAEVILYNAKRNWRIDSARYEAKPYKTNANGEVSVTTSAPGEYWFNVRKMYDHNRFTVTSAVLDGTNQVNLTVPIRDLTQKEFAMCGTCDNKTWITDSIVIFGISQPYDADSKLISDGTWWDSNDNHGFWWFHANETKMTYNYDTNSSNGGGSDVEASLITLNDSIFIGDMTMLGLPVTYYMSVVYDTINLSISGNDTTIQLNSNGTLSLTGYDLNLDYDYCFTCNTVLSQSEFDATDIGPNDITITLTDRCGNTTSTIVTVTIAVYSPNSINEISESDISIYPNPATDFVTVSGTGMEYIDIYSVDGGLIKHVSVSKSQFTISTSEFNQGIYLFKITTSNGSFTKKVVVE